MRKTEGKGRGGHDEREIIAVGGEASMAPTLEQMRVGTFIEEEVTDKRRGGVSVTIGKAYRRRPMIDILHEQGLVDDGEYKALQTYREKADIADRSPLRDSLAKALPADGGDGPTVRTLNAIRTVRDIERAVGSLAAMLRRVVVYDWSLTDWAIHKFGGIDRERVRNGRPYRWVDARKGTVEIARLEIKIAAQRVQAELDA